MADFLGYFLLGYILTVKNVVTKKSVSLTILFIGILWTVLNVIMSSIEEPTINLSFFDYSSPNIIILSIGVFISLHLYSFSLEKRSSEKWKKFLSVTSGATLGVYLFHTLVLQKFDFINHKLSFFSIYQPINNYLNAFIIFSLSLLVILSLQRIPFIGRFVS